MIRNVIDYVVSRLRERSTWLGLVSLVTAAGLVLSEGQQEAIIATGTALAGLIATFTPDEKA